MRVLLALALLCAPVLALAAPPTCRDIVSGPRTYHCTTTESSLSSEVSYDVTLEPDASDASNRRIKMTVPLRSLDCSCDPTGNAQQAKFFSAKSFTCVGENIDGTPIVARGKLNGSGTKIRGWTGYFTFGTTPGEELGSCVLVP
ncbi:hypothetical protein K2Z84_26390 [Candidatus Binatia bacterium]|jgi:hypothetical protein|nr:hypothetical protein [Candidatus Binatia bacterium]